MSKLICIAAVIMSSMMMLHLMLRNVRNNEFNGAKQEFLLDSPSKGLLIEGLVWREMHDFSEGAVLLVLASEHYSEEDYIRDYDVFKQEEMA